MAEEHKCQAAPEGHRLCANNCGFFGSPGTLNLCSKCYRDLRLDEEQASSVKSAVEKSLNGETISVSPPSSSNGTLTDVADLTQNPLSPAPVSPSTAAAPDPAASAQLSQPSRCSTCRKRVRLMGFGCRCGTTFCGTHRYPEQHGCPFDFKGAGREAIAKANPLVKAPKMDMI